VSKPKENNPQRKPTRPEQPKRRKEPYPVNDPGFADPDRHPGSEPDYQPGSLPTDKPQF
jgi:hypothetical protein